MCANQKDEGKTKILIIEDEEQLVDLINLNMKKAGYDVDFAYNGEDGLEKVRSWQPDLVLLDIVMPKMDGYEVLEKLHEEESKIPVVIISNSGQPVEIEKTKKLGAVDHLIKTEFTPQDVLQKVKQNLSAKTETNTEESGEEKEDKEEEESINPIQADEMKDRQTKVLLVEDDRFLREICGRKLTQEGYTVYPAIDGEKALANLEKIKPDIVLLDIILPAINGFEVLEKLKAHNDSKIAQVPVIMLSNLGQEEDIEKAKNMGAVDYLVKAHFTTEEIISKLESILQK